jgi:hypothetical protein
MFTHPVIAASFAEQHRRDLISQAEASRLARAARNCRATPPGRPSLPRRRTGPVQAIRRAAAAVAATAAAVAVMMTPAGATTTQHASAHVYSVPSHHFLRWA